MEQNENGQKLSDDEKVIKIQEYKAKGNSAFKEGQLQKAKGSYHRAILYLKGLSINSPSSLNGMASALGQDHKSGEKMSPDTLELVKTLSCDCYNNLAGHLV